MERVGVYLRISEDKDGEQAATQRQLEDCSKFAANRGWNITDVFEDVDLSAYKRTVKRPEFERMLTAVRNRQIDGVLAWKIDRITRRQRDLVRLDEACEDAGGFIATVQENIDTRESTGRFVAELLVAQARMESQNMSTRIARSHESMAAKGKPSLGGCRAFGYTKDRKRTIAEEVELIKEAAARILMGEGIRGICTDWERRGVKTTVGKPWQPFPLKRLLCNPFLAGQRVHKGIVSQGTWPRILEPEESARIRLLLMDPARRKTQTNKRSYLLSGFLRCGRCGGVMVARPRQDRTRRYVCAHLHARPNCGKVARMAEPIESLVTEMVFLALENADISSYVRMAERRDMSHLEQSIRGDEAALEQLAKDHYADHLIDRAEYLSARNAINERLERNRREMIQDRSHGVLGAIMAGEKLRDVWDGKPLDWKRAILSIVLDHVVILPAVKGRNFFDPSLVQPVWRA